MVNSDVLKIFEVIIYSITEEIQIYQNDIKVVEERVEVFIKKFGFFLPKKIVFFK